MRYNSFKTAGNANWGRFGALYPYRRQLMYGGAGLAVFYAANLEQAPVSHRLRFMIVPHWLERRVGQGIYQQTLSQFSNHILPPTHPETLRVKAVMKKIIQVADLPTQTDWQVHVIRGQFAPNAFVLPGGKVFVFESILPICQNDDGLATLLSHETAHQVCRHTAENMSKTPFMLMASMVMMALFGSGRLENLFTRLVLELPASRQMEKEADYVGLMMMAKACFNPSEAAKMWNRMVSMEKRYGVVVPEWLSTHPASVNRIEQLQKHLPEAQTVRSDHCSDMLAFKGWW